MKIIFHSVTFDESSLLYASAFIIESFYVTLHK